MKCGLIKSASTCIWSEDVSNNTKKSFHWFNSSRCIKVYLWKFGKNRKIIFPFLPVMQRIFPLTEVLWYFHFNMIPRHMPLLLFCFVRAIKLKSPSSSLLIFLGGDSSSLEFSQDKSCLPADVSSFFPREIWPSELKPWGSFLLQHQCGISKALQNPIKFMKLTFISGELNNVKFACYYFRYLKNWANHCQLGIPFSFFPLQNISGIYPDIFEKVRWYRNDDF